MFRDWTDYLENLDKTDDMEKSDHQDFRLDSRDESIVTFEMKS